MSPARSTCRLIASGGAGEASHIAESARGRAGCPACLDPAREPRTSSHAAHRAARARGGAPVKARDRPGLRDRTRSDARVDERRSGTPDARDERGVVLEPIARAAVAERGDVGKHTRGRRASRRLRRRRDPAAGHARRTGVPHRLDDVLRARPLAHDLGGARSSVRTARTPPPCSKQALARVPGRWARRRSSFRSRRSTSRTNGLSRRLPTSCTTSTSCSRHAASISHRLTRRFVLRSSG